VHVPDRQTAVPFEKWQALGNDYLILEREQLPFELSAARVRKLCAAHLGVFADGVLLLARSQDPELVADLRIYNPDGSEAELSGNGAREAILYLRRRGWTGRDSFAIQTAAGTIRPQITGPDTCRVDMGRAQLRSKDFPGGPPDGRGQLTGPAGAGAAEAGTAARVWRFRHVSIGNPQCAIRVPDVAALDALDLPAIGPGLEAHASFPNRTNVSWYAPLGDGERIRARIFERGVGETLSSGTGASGAAIAYALEAGGPPRRVPVVLDGGELDVEVGADLRVHLTGWARPVFAGRLSEELVEELRETE
jgi:diaminopimelate epimerase